MNLIFKMIIFFARGLVGIWIELRLIIFTQWDSFRMDDNIVVYVLELLISSPFHTTHSLI